MAFGSAVTQLNQMVIGTSGYIVKINVASLLAYSIESIQVQADPADTPEPVTSPVVLDILLAYVNDSDCPDAAFSATESDCWIFLKTSEFPFETTTRLALFGKRRPQTISADADYLDIPDSDFDLFLAYCIKLTYGLKKGGVPKWIYEDIKSKERLLRA